MKQEIDVDLLLKKINFVNPFRRKMSLQEAYAVEATKNDIRRLVIECAERKTEFEDEKKCTWCGCGHLVISDVGGWFRGACGICRAPCTGAHRTIREVTDEWNEMMR